MRKHLLILCLLLFSGCTALDNPPVALHETHFSALKGWSTADHKRALSAFLRSCTKLNRHDADTLLHHSGLGGHADRWHALCKEALFASYMDEPNAAKHFFENAFEPYRLQHNGRSEGLLTGYYEIVLSGSYTPTSRYRYPLYAPPPELQKGRKYYSRAQIDAGALKRRDLEIVWLDDPVEAFFLHVQGSGKVMLDNGDVVCVGFAGRNNHPYRSIGRYMIENGWISKEAMSADAIRTWLDQNPDHISSVLNHNPSYIFFKRKRDCTGPVGAQGVALTARHSAAVDPEHIPYGLPLWIDVAFERITQETDKYFQEIVIAQDTGSAIKGQARADLFMGTGSKAGYLAGHISDRGTMVLLLPKEKE